MNSPTTRAVVVNYNGGDQTRACLDALLANDPDRQLEIVLIDNASTDGLIEQIANELPTVRIIRSETNLGFGGANNLALADLTGIEFVALINSDARVHSGWLEPLQTALRADPTLGAACPRIALAGEFVKITITAERAITVAGVTVDDQDTSARMQYGDTFGAPEPPTPKAPRARRLHGSGCLWVPVNPDTKSVLLSVLDGGPAVFHAGNTTVTSDRARAERTVEVPIGPTHVRLLNNTGNYWTSEGFSADRGWLQPDTPDQFAVSDLVETWCGAAVLLRSDYLRATGGFDTKLFLYYEDIDLAERGKNLGWRYRYIPNSTVEHDHASSTGEDSLLALRLTERNRLIVNGRYRNHRMRSTLRSLIATGGYVRRDIFARPLRRRWPRISVIAARLRATAGSAKISLEK